MIYASINETSLGNPEIKMLFQRHILYIGFHKLMYCMLWSVGVFTSVSAYIFPHLTISSNRYFFCNLTESIYDTKEMRNYLYVFLHILYVLLHPFLPTSFFNTVFRIKLHVVANLQTLYCTPPHQYYFDPLILHEKLLGRYKQTRRAVFWFVSVSQHNTRLCPDAVSSTLHHKATLSVHL